MDRDQRRRARTADDREPDGDVRQPALPFEGGEEGPPIGYVLTARARRAVAPDSLPDLEVVPDGRTTESPFDPHDSRPARARALRRAGRSVTEVAEVLGVEPDEVVRWVVGVEPARRGRRTREPSAADPIARADARGEAAAQLAEHDRLEATLHGLVAGLAAVGGETVTVTLPDPALAPLVVRHLEERAEGGPGAVHLLVAAGPTVARDLVAQRWGQACGLPAARVSHAPLHEAGTADAVRLTVRVRDAHLAAEVLGWRDALGQLVAPPDGGEDDRAAS